MAVITSADGTDDTIFGTLDLTDVIFGGTGNASQGQPSGSDVLYGGPETSAGSGVPVETNTGNDTIHGGAGNDIIYGFDDDDRLIGGDDNDVLYGGFNDDTLFSGDGDDTAFGGNQNDVIEGNNGNDVLYGGSGTDEISAGRDDDNVFGGADGDDISGGLGNDTIEGGAGADTLDGGNDDGDIVSFASSSGAVAVDLAAETLIGGDATGDTIERFEGILGSDFNDNLIGNAASNTIIGGDGDDTIEGGEGADTLDGGAGNADIVNYENSNEALAINLDLSTPSGGHANGDVISNFENVRGTDFNDDIRGSGADNTLFGGQGNDGLFGQGGRDELFGGAGNDGLNVGINLSGLVAGEVYDGGADFDRLQINTFNGGTHDFRTITLVDIERFQIGNAFAGDVVVQFNAAQIQANFDEIDVSARIDRTRVIEIDMDGVVDFDLSAVTVTGLNASASNAPSGDGFVINGDSDAETITGSAFRDTILAGSGNDTVEGGGGVDTLDGGEGFDTLTYESATSGLQLSLLQGRGNFGFSIGDTFTGFERFIGSDFDDIILGNTDGVTLIGGGGNDFLSDSDGVDALFGGVGNDRLSVTSVATVGQILDGGADFDELFLDGGGVFDLRDDTVTDIEQVVFFPADGVSKTLQVSVAQAESFDAVLALAHTGAFLTEIELGSSLSLDLSGVSFGGAFDQPGDGTRITGDGDNENIVGTSIIDTILAGGGNDTVAGGAGGDRLDGGAGFDILTYEAASSGVNLSLSVGIGTLGEAFQDQITGFEHVIGSNFNDGLLGSTSAETLTGLDGDDFLSGRGGADALFGGAGDDDIILIGSDAGMIFDGGADADELFFLDGGTSDLRDDTVIGIEQLVFFDASGADARVQMTAAQAESFDVILALAHSGAFVTEIELGSSLSLDLTGIGFGGSFNQPGDGVQINGDGDGEVISASNIADTVEGNGGNDSIAGNAGSDLIFGGLGDDTLEGGADADAILGGIGSDILFGDGGSDILVGAADDDVLYGGADDDFLEGGAGADAFFGGAGFDVVNHFLATSGVTVDLSGTFAGAGDAAGDTYDSIEAIQGAVGFANTLIGDGDANDLTGGTLGDLLQGGLGADTLDGDLGADTMEGGAGDDTYRVNLASDIVTELAGEGIDIVLTEVSITAADNVELVRAVNASVQNLTAASTGTWLIGNAIANTLTGDSGNDRLQGQDGDDLLSGLGGNDIYEGGAGADTFVLGSDDGFNIIRDFEIGVDLIDISAAGQDFNSLIFKDTSEGVVISYDITGTLGQVLLNGQKAGELSASNFIEGIVSTPGPITGTAGADNLVGTVLDDVLLGGDGNDQLNGGAGADVMDGGADDDRIFVDDAGDVVIEAAGGGYDRIYTSISLTLAENVEAGQALGTTDLSIQGNAEDNWITGNSGNNVLGGATGNDRLLGLDGDDTLNGGTGNDVLQGGTGGDVFLFNTGDNLDVILDYVAAEDTIRFEGGVDFNALTVSQAGNNVLIAYGSDLIVVLNGLEADFSASEFEFI